VLYSSRSKISQLADSAERYMSSQNENHFVLNGVEYFAAPHDGPYACKRCAMQAGALHVTCIAPVSCTPGRRDDQRNVVFLTLGDYAAQRMKGDDI
jgi:hypothetical protein